MRYTVIKMKWITRSFVQQHPDYIFLFGDNLARRGFGGQAAAMRNEPNALGIPTKKLPSRSANAFFTDSEFQQNKAAIDDAFEKRSRRSSSKIQTVVTPKDGIGTGRAELKSRAPQTYEYLQKRLRELSRE